MAGRSKNLLKNPCGKGGLDHWEVVCSGGDGFTVEESPVGCKQLSECTSVKKDTFCWATSHDPCEKVQLVDLVDAGVSGDKLDKKPPITIRDWYCPRGDCGCSYRISARLLNGDKEELDKWEFNDTKEEGQDWVKAKHIFKDYPTGVRYVEFKHGGEDTKNWAGHFGAKMTMSGVFVGQKRKKRTKRAVEAACGKNLLKNPCAKDEFNGWAKTSNGGDGFIVETESAGCKDLKDFNEDAEDNCCWTTSHGPCEKTQTIDLGFEGFDGDLMDDVQPEIKVSEWFASRTDAGCVYWLRVRLVNADMEEIDKIEVREEKEASGDWFHVSKSLSGYGPGVRFVEYTHGGQDNCGWAGHYGAKISCSSLVVCLPEKDKSSSSSSSSSSEEEY